MTKSRRFVAAILIAVAAFCVGCSYTRHHDYMNGHIHAGMNRSDAIKILSDYGFAKKYEEHERACYEYREHFGLVYYDTTVRFSTEDDKIVDFDVDVIGTGP